MGWEVQFQQMDLEPRSRHGTRWCRSFAFVKTGKIAEISIDSFPASDFGVITGVVKSIGSDALAPQPALRKGYRFPAKISLDNQSHLMDCFVLKNSIKELRENTTIKYEHIFETIEYQVPAIKLLKNIIEKRELILDKMNSTNH